MSLKTVAEIKTVLLVADDDDLREYIRIRLERPELYFMEARDAVTGLRLAKQALPHLVLLDAATHGLDGPDFVGALRLEPEMAGTKILVLAAPQRCEEVEQGRATGADICLARQLDPEDLVRSIEEALA